MKRIAAPHEGQLIERIYFIRGQKVMIDRHLAELYGVETKALKQAVRRNSSRFPSDFMFQMTTNEIKIWRSQIVTSKNDSRGLRHAPFCFTEQGVTMLSCILNSRRAIEVNVRVIRIFAQLRETLLSNRELLHKIKELELNVVKNSKDVQLIFTALKELVEKPNSKRKMFGYAIHRKKKQH